MLRMSTLLLRTLRDDPADAEVASHRLLVRAGFVRRVAAGIYSWLPLGYRTYRKIENVIREEMDAAGFQEVHFPALLPRDPYEATNRWTEYGDNLFRLMPLSWHSDPPSPCPKTYFKVDQFNGGGSIDRHT